MEVKQPSQRAAAADAPSETSDLRLLKEAFAYFDRRNANSIAAKDVGVVLRSMGKHVADADVASVAMKDGDGERQVGWDELLFISGEIDRHRAVEYSDEALDEAFYSLSSSETARVPLPYLRSLLLSMGAGAEEEEVDAMLATLLKDYEGGDDLDLDAFKSLFS